MAEDPVCPHAPLIDANDLGTRDCSSARRNLLTKHLWSIRVRLEIARSVCDSTAAMRAKIVGDIVWRIIRSKHPAAYLYLCARLRRSIFLTGRYTSVSEVVTNRKKRVAAASAGFFAASLPCGPRVDAWAFGSSTACLSRSVTTRLPNCWLETPTLSLQFSTPGTPRVRVEARMADGLSACLERFRWSGQCRCRTSTCSPSAGP
jgi:hypothetical protein